jgi:hypothetical protein
VRRRKYKFARNARLLLLERGEYLLKPGINACIRSNSMDEFTRRTAKPYY